LATKEEEILEKIINLITLLIYKQSQILFIRLFSNFPLYLIVELIIAQFNNSLKELLLNILINKIYKDASLAAIPNLWY
jgi:hypothetical protein